MLLLYLIFRKLKNILRSLMEASKIVTKEAAVK
jgi:hypothetical protein